jgi:AraC-like DNA-binding protein
MAVMRRVEDVSSFLVAPAGDHYHETDSFLVWRMSADLLGFSIWSDRNRTSVEQQARILDYFTEPAGSCSRQRVLIDVSSCSDASPTTFSRRARHAAAIEQLAVVVPQGVAGAVVVGLSVLVQAEFALRMFSDMTAALDWLQCDRPALLAQQLASLRRPAADQTLLACLHRMFMETHFSLSLGQAARRIGMSQRTLQRRLSEARTTFHAELSSAKLEMAKTLMSLGGRSMTAIALELGFASVQHFSSRFSAIHGESPSSWLRSRSALPTELTHPD